MPLLIPGRSKVGVGGIRCLADMLRVKVKMNEGPKRKDLRCLAGRGRRE